MYEKQPDSLIHEDPSVFEKRHVQEVYNCIAPHFSHTRYKPWPVIEKFIKNIPVGSILLDVGCGNGKYLGLRKDIYAQGSDFSAGLVDVCASHQKDALLADNLVLPYRCCADYVISIAVIHHFATHERRSDAVKELFRVLKPGGLLLIFVWAYEKDDKKKTSASEITPLHSTIASTAIHPESVLSTPTHQNSAIDVSSTLSSSDAATMHRSQDVFVPWHLQPAYQSDPPPPPTHKKERDDGTSQLKVYQRYYHLFKQGELDHLLHTSLPTASFTLLESSYDHENWYVILQKKNTGQ